MLTDLLSTPINDMIKLGGFSWNPTTDDRPVDGYMVAVTGYTLQVPITMDRDQIALAIVAYIKSYRPLFDADPNLYMGGWVQNGTLWIEPSERFEDRDAAIKAGVERDQIAIYDVFAGEEIETGGNGGLGATA